MVQPALALACAGLERGECLPRAPFIAKPFFTVARRGPVEFYGGDGENLQFHGSFMEGVHRGARPSLPVRIQLLSSFSRPEKHHQTDGGAPPG